MSNLSNFRQNIKSSVSVNIPAEHIDALIDAIAELCSKGKIRKSGDIYSVHDVIANVCGKKGEREVWNRLVKQNPAVVTFCDDCQFPGERQRKTPCTNLAGLIEIIWLLPGSFSDKMRNIGAQMTASVIEQVKDAEQPQLPAQNSLNAHPNLHEMFGYIQQTAIALKQMQLQLNTVLPAYKDFRALTNFTEENLPGLLEINENIIEMGGKLPPVRMEFTAPEWVRENASNLTQIQRIRFYRMVAEITKVLGDEMPPKICGVYQYSTKHEVLFNRIKSVILAEKGGKKDA